MRIVPFQTLTRYHGYIFRLLWAFLLSLPALVIACVNDDSEFSGKIFSLEETLIVPSQLALNRVKMRSYEHFSLLLGIYHSDFFCRSGKGNEKVSFLCFHTSVTCHLTLSHPLLADSDFQLNSMFPTGTTHLKSWKMFSCTSKTMTFYLVCHKCGDSN